MWVHLGRVYGASFFAEVESESAVSSRELVPYFRSFAQPQSVLDVGCGTGVFLRAFIDAGVEDVCGVDGDYVPHDMLRIPAEKFTVHDLEREFDLGRQYDLVLCLEVAEHISEDASCGLIRSLTRHGDLIAFSAAVPGQGGTNHINEQFLSYWKEKFLAEGYVIADILRPLIWEEETISWFYRQNLVFFFRAGSGWDKLLEVPSRCSIQDIVHPHIYRYRVDVAEQLDAALASAGLRTQWDNGVLVGLHADARTVLSQGSTDPDEREQIGPTYLRFPSVVNSVQRRKRVCILTRDIKGPIRNGGIGTAYYALAEQLVNAGYQVTVLYTLGQHCESGTMDQWVASFHRAGIRLLPMPSYQGPNVDCSHYSQRAFHVFQWMLKHQHEFEIIHTPEWAGEAYYCLVAKKQGLAFGDTLFCVGTHSPWMWHKLGNRQYVNSLDDMVIDFLERETVRLADFVISPSIYMLSWMLENGWTLPASTFVEPNLSILSPLSPNILEKEMPRCDDGLTRLEIVFFGRLETRKGIELFCDAVSRSQVADRDDVMVTFLGKQSQVDGEASASYIKKRSDAWRCKSQLIDTFGSEQAIAYLRRTGIVAVIPSLVENSPYTVVECLHHGISFIASRVGGIPELVHPECLEEITFLPTPPALAEALNKVLVQGTPTPTASPMLRDGSQRWVAWHDAVLFALRPEDGDDEATPVSGPLVSVCITHYNRPTLLDQAIESIRKQTYQNIEVIVVDDGSTTQAAKNALKRLLPEFALRGWKIVFQENAYLGAARNTAARHASGSYLLFMDDDNVAKPREVELFLKVALKTNADILTCVMDVFSDLEAPQVDREPTLLWVPLGNATEVGVLRNAFGDANAFMKTDAFRRVGGFTEDYGLGHEDWEFFARASLMGLDIQVIPMALFWYRSRHDSMVRTTSLVANNLRQMRPYVQAMPERMRNLALLVQGYHFNERASVTTRAASVTTRAVMVGVPVEMSGASPRDIALQLQRSRSLGLTRAFRKVGAYLGRGAPPLESYVFASDDEAIGFIHMVLNSTSWNMTAPIRMLGRLVRRLRMV